MSQHEAQATKPDRFILLGWKQTYALLVSQKKEEIQVNSTFYYYFSLKGLNAVTCGTLIKTIFHRKFVELCSKYKLEQPVSTFHL